MRDGSHYRDEYGQTWTIRSRFNGWFVWNPKMGWGLWDNGRGLELIH